MSLIRKHVAVLQAWACLDLVFKKNYHPIITAFITRVTLLMLLYYYIMSATLR